MIKRADLSDRIGKSYIEATSIFWSPINANIRLNGCPMLFFGATVEVPVSLKDSSTSHSNFSKGVEGNVELEDQHAAPVDCEGPHSLEFFNLYLDFIGF